MDTKKIQNEIIEKIKSGKVKKRPHWYFVLRTSMITAGIFLCFFVAAYLGSFLDLVSSEHEFGKVFALGPQGFVILTQTLPWLIVASLVIVLISTYYLSRHFEFAYQKPVLYILLFLIIVTLVILEFIRFVDPGKGFAKIGEKNIFIGLHDRYRSGMQGELIHGVVKGVDGNFVTVEAVRGSSTAKVIVDNKTMNRKELEGLETGEKIFIISEIIQGTTTRHAIFLDDKPIAPSER